MSAHETAPEAKQSIGASGSSRLTNVLQISGSNNFVIAVARTDVPALEPALPWRELPDVLPKRLGIPNLLTWQSRLAPLVGRDTVLAELHEWAEQKDDIRVRLLSGRGGSGKSRLAAEFAAQLRDRGWSAGFLSLSTLSKADAHSYSLGEAGILLIVDYPEEHRRESQLLLQQLAGLEAQAGRIRVLLVSRQPLDWWLKDVYAVHAESILDEYEVGLDRLTDSADILALFRAVEQRLQTTYGLNVPELSDTQILDWASRDPTHNTTPLIITAAAIQARTEQSAALSGSADVIIQRLARRELARIENFGSEIGISAGRIGKLIGLSTLAGGVDVALARHLARPEFRFGLPDAHDMAALVHQIPGWHEARLQPVSPDIIGAALLFEAMAADPGRASDWLWAVLSYCAKDPALIGRLGRILYDIRTIYGSDDRRVGKWLSGVLQDDSARALTLEPLFFDVRSPDLSQFALQVSELLIKLTAVPLRTRAARLRRYANWLTRSREIIKAREHAEEAVRTARDLVLDDDSSESRAELASCLHDLSILFSRLRDGKKALEAIGEAVEIRRKLANHESKYEERLASSLQNLSNYASEFLADKQLSLDAVNEAISVYKRIWVQDPDKHDREYARSMHNLSNRRWEHGDLSGSLTAAKTAVDLYQRLYDADPGSNSEGLAGALMLLSHRLNNSGDAAGARAHAEQAFAIRSQLAAAFPISFGADLLDCQRVISDRHQDLGNREEGLATARDATSKAELFSNAYPGQFEIELSACKVTLASRLGELGSLEEAVNVSGQAVVSARSAVTTDPKRQQMILAWALQTLAHRTAAIGDFSTSLPAIAEAVRIREQLFVDNPMRAGSDLVGALLWNSFCLDQAGRWLKAAALAKRAVDVCNDLIGKGMPRFETELAASHLDLSWRYGNAGFAFLAASHAEAAIKRYTALSKVWPDQFEPRLRSAYYSLSLQQSRQGEPSQSLESINSAISVIRKHYKRLPKRYGPELSDSLTTLADRHFERSEVSDATAALEESLAIRIDLLKEAPNRFRQAVAQNLLRLAVCLRDESRTDEALKRTEEAITYLKALDSKLPMVRADLAYALIVQSDNLAKVERHKDALNAAEGAVELARQASEHVPERYLEDFASRLRSVSFKRASAGDKAGAVEALKEAAHVMRELTSRYPRRYSSLLATTLRIYWLRQQAAGASDRKLLEEAVDLLREGVRQEPWRYRAELGRNRRDFALARLSSSELEPQIQAAREAARLFEALNAKSPAVFGSEFTDTLMDVASMFRRNGRLKDSRQFAEHAVRVARANHRRSPKRHSARLVNAAIELSQCLRGLGQFADAILALREAIDLLGAAPNRRAVNERLAMQYLDLARLESEVGPPTSAVVTTQRAISLFEDVAKASGNSMALMLADSYFFLFLCREKLGATHESLMAIDLAVKLTLQLNEEQRKRNIGWLTHIWEARARQLGKLGIATDAATAAGKAIAIQKGAADVESVGVRRRLTDLFLQHSTYLEQSGRVADAWSAAVESWEMAAALPLLNPARRDSERLDASYKAMTRLGDLIPNTWFAQYSQRFLGGIKSTFRRIQFYGWQGLWL